MTRIIRLSVLAAAGIAVAGTAFAQNNDPAAAAVKARQAHMELYSANLGVLGGMAQGRMDYDAEAAQAAADNLAALASMSQRFYWLPGTHVGAVENTRALEAIWAEDSTIGDEAASLVEAAAAMQEAAGGGLESLQGAIGPLGASCGSCHESYRQSNN